MIQKNHSAVIIPSSDALSRQIAAAMAKCDGDREQAVLRRDARRDRLVARGIARAVRGRIYDAIQRGHG